MPLRGSLPTPLFILLSLLPILIALYFILMVVRVLADAPPHRPRRERSRLWQLIFQASSFVRGWFGFFIGGLVGAVLADASKVASDADFRNLLTNALTLFVYPVVVVVPLWLFYIGHTTARQVTGTGSAPKLWHAAVFDVARYVTPLATGLFMAYGMLAILASLR